MLKTQDRLREYLEKAEQAEQQAAKATQQRVKQCLLKVAATYREAAKVLKV